MFSFLSKINFGYANIETTAADIYDLNSFFNLIDKNLDSLINDDSIKIIDAGNKKINDLITTFESYKSELDNFENQYNTYKGDIDKQIEEGRKQIDDAFTELDIYETEIDRLESKYN